MAFADISGLLSYPCVFFQARTSRGCGSRLAPKLLCSHVQMSYSLNSLEGGCMRDHVEEYHR